MKALSAAVLAATFALLASTAATADAVPAFRLKSSVRASQPTWVGTPRGDARLFVAERSGRILVWDHGRKRVFLDIRNRVNDAGGEQGLLGVAFHWKYRTNGRFFVYYTNSRGDGRVVQYRARGNAARRSSARTILGIGLGSGADNHNGGMLWHTGANNLYISVGDGGSNHELAQDRTSLRGKLLRVNTDNGYPYTIPAGNPYGAGSGFRREIYAIGLRNAWRFSYDYVSKDLHIADVGQSAWEEVNRLPDQLPAGANFGWDRFEGTSVYNNGTSLAAGTSHRTPVQKYAHGSDACSITGGVVYRGDTVRALRGYYLYADYCGEWIRGMRLGGGGDWKRNVGVPGISTFGIGPRREVYAASLSRGIVYRIVRPR